MINEPFAIDLLRALAIIVIAPICITSIAIVVRLIGAHGSDRSEYLRNRERSPSVRDVLAGNTPTYHDGIRDERVSAGVAVDINKNVWVEQGKLSEEAVASVLR